MTTNQCSTIACDLSGVNLAQRMDFITQEILSGATGTVELEDGYELQFPGDESWLRRITDFVAFERQCCSFFHFEISTEPNHGTISLRLRGGSGVKAYLEEAISP